MRNPKVFLTDTLNRIKRSIEVSGTGMNFRGRKAIDFSEFRRRYLRKIVFTGGEDKKGYYGVQAQFVVDGSEFIFDTARKRAMVYDKDHKAVIFDIYDEKMIKYLNLNFSSDFGKFMLQKHGSGVTWRDYVNPTSAEISETILELLKQTRRIAS